VTETQDKLNLNQFKALILSFREAPVSIREKVALNQNETTLLLQRLKEYTTASEFLVLSTCNRTEIYYLAANDCCEAITSLLCILKNINTSELQPYIKQIIDHDLATQHLYEVSLGLDSQVLGDLQIISQVKQAYQASADQQAAGPFIHRLLHAIFFANKRVVQETSFRDGASSISYLAADLIQQTSEHLDEPRVLILGLGEIGQDVSKNLADRGIKNIVVLNRTFEKAISFASEYGLTASPFSNLVNELRAADVVVSSANAGSYLVTPRHFIAPTVRGKVFIDLSVPRSIDPTIESIPGFNLYNIDELEAKTNEVVEQRMKAVNAVKQIIEDSIEQFSGWAKEAEMSPLINKFKHLLEQMRQEEISKYLKGLDPKEQEMMDKVTKGLLQRIIKLPVIQLKAACKRGNPETLMEGLNDLFNLEEERKINQNLG